MKKLGALLALLAVAAFLSGCHCYHHHHHDACCGYPIERAIPAE